MFEAGDQRVIETWWWSLISDASGGLSQWAAIKNYTQTAERQEPTGMHAGVSGTMGKAEPKG